MNIIDSFFVALGFSVDTKGIDTMKGKVDSAKESLLSWGGALTGIFAGLAIHEVAKIGSTFEQNRIQIAGFLSALGQSSDFNNGLKDAAGVIQQITNDAAKLPGEADEYIEVFKAGFPFVQGAMPGGSLKQMTDFTNKLTAIGKTFGLDAGVISREFDHMLSPDKGMASLRLPLFRQLLPFMKQVEGHAKLTAESFNQMTAPERLQLLTASFAKLQPMLDASADSFDAMWGALVSNVKQLTRMGTEGLFSGMKKGLDQLNGMFFKADGSMTEFGKNTVAGIKEITHFISQLLVDGMQLVEWLGKLRTGGLLAKEAFGLFGVVMAGLAVEKFAAKFTSLASAIKSSTFMAGGLAIAIALIAEDLWGFFHGSQSVTGILVDEWPPAIAAVIALLGGLTLALSPVLFTFGLIGLAVLLLGKNWDAISARFTRGLNRIIDGFNDLLDAANKVIEAFGGKGFEHVGHVNLNTGTEEPDALKGFTVPAKPFQKLSDVTGDARPAWLTPNPKYADRRNGPLSVQHGEMHFVRGGHGGAQPSASGVAPGIRGGDATYNIHIHTPTKDPHEHGEIVRRVMRTHASGVVR